MFKEVLVDSHRPFLPGHLNASNQDPKGWVIFAHGSGSSRHSPRNNFVAEELNKLGYGTFLFDLLTKEEDLIFQNRFNIDLIAERLIIATRWFLKCPDYNGTPIAFFGASTGAAAALDASINADSSWPLFAIISRGGRPDLADLEQLHQIQIPTLLIVGELDFEVRQLNAKVLKELPLGEMRLIEGATHLFEEPGSLEMVLTLVHSWLDKNLNKFNAGPTSEISRMS